MTVAMSPAGGSGGAGEGGSWDSKVVETPVGRFARGKDCWSADGWLCGQGQLYGSQRCLSLSLGACCQHFQIELFLSHFNRTEDLYARQHFGEVSPGQGNAEESGFPSGEAGWEGSGFGVLKSLQERRGMLMPRSPAICPGRPISHEVV